ncbi:hypothetical protein MMC30_000411 [Trapelia coarctata]|nr:hypothetical protein [Trapelia coarctata]
MNDESFAAKVNNFTTANPSTAFAGPLAFLNSYEYIMSEGLLTGLGASAEFQAGVSFWNRYGRTLFNASLGQVGYNASFPNGTSRPKPVLRTTGQSRIENSQINWALGFFGPTFQAVPNAAVANATSDFSVVIIPEGGTENNTLASYDSCSNDNVPEIGYIGDDDVYTYIPVYLQNATARLQSYAPIGFQLTTNDTYAMQSICAYESGYIGSSDFCNLFTEDEWAGFENTLDIEYYYDYAYGNPTGRAQGIGYVQELFARLQNQYITSSTSSVNSTIDNNPQQFPLGQAFYADFTHDDTIVSVLTALSVDFFREAPSLTQFPPDPNRHFILSKMTPFGGRLITEVIGCNDPNPSPVHDHRTQYYPTQYGYDPAKATNKFIRMRLNNGIVPLDTIRGGLCGGEGGMCAIGKFVESQKDADRLAKYGFACFGNYTVDNVGSRGQDYDGTISA